MNRIFSVALVIVGIIGLIGVAFLFLDGDSDTEEANLNNPADVPATVNPMGSPDSVEDQNQVATEADQTYEIVMTDFSFSEEQINARPGETVTIDLSVQSGSHDFVIDEFNTRSQIIGSGQTDSITFTVPEDVAPGTTYDYYCSVGNHRQLGMEGQLVIVE